MAMMIGGEGCTPSWRTVDRATLIASTAILACDWGQTRSAAAEGWTGRREGNVLMGERPSTSTVDAYFAATAVLNTAVWVVLPAKWRSVIPGVVIGAQVRTVAGNFATTRGVCGA